MIQFRLLVIPLAVSLLAPLVCVTASATTQTRTDTVTSGDGLYTYAISPEKEAWITEYHPQDEENALDIPDTLGGCPITRLENEVFAGKCHAARVQLPNTLLSIGDSCFQDCPLSELVLPAGLKTIGNSAFQGCLALAEVSVPDTVTEIGYDAFANTRWEINYPEPCIILGNGILYLYKGTDKALTLPDTVQTIGAYAFENADMLTTLVMPESVSAILDGAFSQCESLSDITFSPSLMQIAGDALVTTAWFQSHTEDFVTVENILYKYKGSDATPTLPDGITIIGETAFERCSTLTRLTLPDGITEIQEAAFYGCPTLKSVSCPDSLKKVGKMAFYNCVALQQISLGNQLVELDDLAFSTCTALYRLALPKSLTRIGEMAVGYAYVDASTGYKRQDGFTLYSDAAPAKAYASAANIICKSYTEDFTDADASGDTARGILHSKWLLGGCVAIALSGMLIVMLYVSQKKREKKKS